jgi:N-acetyl-alpha-D-muramate 1-phosphate uridylyltransferase
MRERTEGRPKYLLPVREEPFAHHQLRLLASQGVTEVVLVVGHGGSEIRESIGDGERFGLAVTYVDEGGELHGTGGALRLALDQGVLADPAAVLYGDSYLPIDLGAVWAAFDPAVHRALMTVVRNRGQWDASNAILEGEVVTLYDKGAPPGAGLEWIDFGFNILRQDAIEEIPAGAVVDLADVLRELSLRGELRGYEVESRFYEVGSPEGLADLEEYLAATEGSRPSRR